MSHPSHFSPLIHSIKVYIFDSRNINLRYSLSTFQRLSLGAAALSMVGIILSMIETANSGFGSDGEQGMEDFPRPIWSQPALGNFSNNETQQRPVNCILCLNLRYSSINGLFSRALQKVDKGTFWGKNRRGMNNRVLFPEVRVVMSLLTS